MTRLCRDCKEAKRLLIANAGAPWALDRFTCPVWGCQVDGDDTCQFFEPRKQTQSPTPEEAAT